MHKIQRTALSLVPIAILIPLMAEQPPLPELAGRWRSTAVSSAGVSTIFEFRADNQLDSSSAAITEEKYRLVGTDTIVFQSGNGQKKLELEWDNQNRAKIDDEAAGKASELVRIGTSADSKNPLTGEWSTTREWNGRKYPAWVCFFPDGKVVWIVTLRTDRGSYSVQSKSIRLEIPGRPAVEGSYAVNGTRLTLPTPNGGEVSFDRF